MKKNKREEIRNKTIEELIKEIPLLEMDLVKIKIDFKMGKLKNTSLIRVKSDELAVFKTLVREKEFALPGKDETKKAVNMTVQHTVPVKKTRRNKLEEKK